MMCEEDENSLDAELRAGESSDTIGGLVTEIAGRVPSAGEVFHARDYALTVLAVEGGRVVQVQVTPRELVRSTEDDATPRGAAAG